MTLLWKADFSALHDSCQADFGVVERQKVGGSIIKPGPPIPGAHHPKLGDCLDLTLVEGETRLEARPREAGSLTEGMRRYFRFDFALADDFVLPPPDWVVINQIHQAENSSPPPVEFVIVDHELRLNINYVDDLKQSGDENPRLRRKLCDLVADEAYSVVFQIRFSASPEKCLINCWVNGKRKILDLVPPTPNVYGGGPSYWKGATLYCGKDAAPLTVFQKNHRVGTSHVDVAGPT